MERIEPPWQAAAASESSIKGSAGYRLGARLRADGGGTRDRRLFSPARFSAVGRHVHTEVGSRRVTAKRRAQGPHKASSPRESVRAGLGLPRLRCKSQGQLNGGPHRVRAPMEVTHSVEACDDQGEAGQQPDPQQTAARVVTERFEAVAVLGVVEAWVLDFPAGSPSKGNVRPPPATLIMTHWWWSPRLSLFGFRWGRQRSQINKAHRRAGAGRRPSLRPSPGERK